jgi:hypothetical protein
MEGERHDALAYGEAAGLRVESGAESDDFAGQVAAEDGGKVLRELVFGSAAADLPIDRIEAGGVDADENFPVLGFRARGFGVAELVDSAIGFDKDGFHAGLDAAFWLEEFSAKEFREIRFEGDNCAS